MIQNIGNIPDSWIRQLSLVHQLSVDLAVSLPACLSVCLSAVFTAIFWPILIKFGGYVGRCYGQYRFSNQPAAPPSGGEIDKKRRFVNFSCFHFFKI
jgi:hypothetical protein